MILQMTAPKGQPKTSRITATVANIDTQYGHVDGIPTTSKHYVLRLHREGSTPMEVGNVKTAYGHEPFWMKNAAFRINDSAVTKVDEVKRMIAAEYRAAKARNLR